VSARPASRLARLLLLAFVLPAAAGGDEPATDRERVRVATLLPFVEDALRRVPHAVTVVATVRRSLHDPPGHGAIDLGSAHAPSFERLAQADADVVVGDAGIHARLASQVERLGAEMLLLETRSVAATLSDLVRVGARVGARAELARAVAEVRRGLEALALGRSVPTLALFGTPGSFFAFTERAWLGDLLTRLNFQVMGAGGGDERFPGLVALSDEVVATLEPELVVLVAHGEPEAIREAFRRRMAAGGAWRSVRASAGDHVHVLDPDVFGTNPGLALPRAARALVALAPPGTLPAVSAGRGAEPAP